MTMVGQTSTASNRYCSTTRSTTNAIFKKAFNCAESLSTLEPAHKVRGFVHISGLLGSIADTDWDQPKICQKTLYPWTI